MIKKMISIMDRHQKSSVCLLLVMIFGGSLLETFGVSAILPLVSAVTDPSVFENNKYFQMVGMILDIKDSRMFILIMALGLVVIYIVKNIYLILLNIAQNRFYTNNLRRLSTRLMRCYVNQGYLFHAEHNVAELVRNVDQDVSHYMYVLNNVLMLITECLVCVMLTIFLMVTDVFTTTLIIIILAVFMVFFIFGVKKRLKYYGERSRKSENDKNRFFLEAFGGIKEVKAASNEAFFAERYDTAYKEYAYMEQKRLVLSFIPRPLMESICICGILLFMSIRIVMGVDFKTFVPVLSVFALAAIRMLPSFNRISGYLGSIMFYRASIDALCNDLKEVERLESIENGANIEADIPQADIVVENLTFAYPTRPDRKILDNVSIRIPCNKSVAFVGPSGAGKTTLADIILGILDPLGGTVTVGNVNVLMSKSSWHKKIGYIPQSTFLSDDTIRANVAFGVPSEEIDDDKVWKALRAAQISEFVEEQSDGIYSNIGDRGVKISGGQRQRLGIARALYNDPDVIVLDEATSALDNETEKAVMNAIYQLSGKKTMIIIAHRLTTIQNCDVIYEINDGKATVVSYESVAEHEQKK